VNDVDVVRQLAQVAEYPLAALVLAHVVLYTELRGLWRANHFLVEQISFSLLYSMFYLRSVLRIRDPVPFLTLDPGFGMGKKTGSGIRDE
jgi:hypothetical protein